MELRRYEDARNAFGRAVDADAGFAAAHYNLSFVLSQLGDFDGALRETRRALELEPLYVPQKYSLTIDLQFEDPAIAIAPELAAEAAGDELAGEFEFDAPALDRIFEELTPGPQQAPAATAPGDALDLARDYIGKGLLDLALAEVSRATARGAPRATAAVLLGDVFAKRGLYGEALERYREARAAAPDDPDATLGEIRALLALGWASDAAPLADELARRVRGDVEVLVARARVRLAVNDALGALDCIREAQSLAPGRADLLHLQAQVSSRLGDRSAALAAFNAALQLDPSLVRVWYELGALEEERENWAAARAAYERALDLLPTYSAAALALADLLGRRESPRAAIAVLIRLLETDPWELEALTALGRALLDEGRTGQALEAFSRVLRFDPEHAAALYHQGAALARQRRFDEAVEAWERVVQLDPAGPYAPLARSRARSARDLQHIFAASAG
jgi:tetratricopeptide (TPR) repeat protein